MKKFVLAAVLAAFAIPHDGVAGEMEVMTGLLLSKSQFTTTAGEMCVRLGGDGGGCGCDATVDIVCAKAADWHDFESQRSATFVVGPDGVYRLPFYQAIAGM